MNILEYENYHEEKEHAGLIFPTTPTSAPSHLIFHKCRCIGMTRWKLYTSKKDRGL